MFGSLVQEARLVGFQDTKFLRQAEVALLCTIDIWCCFVLYFPANSIVAALVFDFPDLLFPYKKPGNQLLYINTQSNHPPTIIKHLPAAISRRISDISCNQEIFDKAKPEYEKALRDSGYTEDLLYVKTLNRYSTTARRI